MHSGAGMLQRRVGAILVRGAVPGYQQSAYIPWGIVASIGSAVLSAGRRDLASDLLPLATPAETLGLHPTTAAILPLTDC